MKIEDQNDRVMGKEEFLMHQLKSRATELLIREEWEQSIQAYSQFISLCQTQISNPNPDIPLSKLYKSLCLAFSNRAEAQSHMRQFTEALQDCDSALKIENPHFKTLICKGKILLNLNMYSLALNCFQNAFLDPHACSNTDSLNAYLNTCRKLETQSRTGSLDLSDWISCGAHGKFPDLAEYINRHINIKRSEVSGRGLFATKNIEMGTLVIVTKAMAVERAILPISENSDIAKLVMWKKFVEKVTESADKCLRTRNLIRTLSTGENEETLNVPEMCLFRDYGATGSEELDGARILDALDVNSFVEDSISGKVFGKNSRYYGVGLWVLPSFMNHSCVPNCRRLHVGDHVLVHASRDIKVGEELTFPYFDVLLPLEKRQALCQNWGFKCYCERCLYEKKVCSTLEMREIELGVEMGLLDTSLHKLEERMRRWAARGREKGYLRASFWSAFSEVYGSKKLVRRKIPSLEIVMESVFEAVGGDERVLKTFIGEMKRNGKEIGLVEMAKVMKLGRGVYGKVVKKQAMMSLLEFCIPGKC